MTGTKRNPHKFGLITASAFVVANMIGTGVFTSLGFQLLETSNFLVILLLWLLGGIIALCGALVYGELGAAMPRSGGEYHYLSTIYHPALGIMSGWASMIVGFAAPIALACMALSRYLHNVYSFLNPSLVGIGVLTLITIIHSYDVKMGGKAQNFFTFFKILIILIFIICGFIFPSEYQPIAPSVSSFSWNDVFSTGFAVSLVWVYFAYSGWNASAYMANEIKDPQKTVPKSLLISTLVVTILYLLLNAVFLLTTPTASMSGQIEVGLISAQHIFGYSLGNTMGLLISLLLVSSISSMVFIASRVSQVMGEDIHLLRALAHKNSRGVPVTAIWVQYAISFALIITNSFELVTKYTGVTLSFFSLMTVIGVFVHRRKFPTVHRPYKTWGYPIVPLIFIALILWSMVYLVQDDFRKTDSGAQMYPYMTLLSLFTLLSGLFIYYLNLFVEKKSTKSRMNEC